MEAPWLISDMEMDDSFHNQWELTTLDGFNAQQLAVALGLEDFQQLPPTSESCCNSHSSYQSSVTSETPKKAVKTNYPIPILDASSPNILSFGNTESPKHQCKLFQSYNGVPQPHKRTDSSVPLASKRNYATMDEQTTRNAVIGVRPTSDNREHVMAERKRREKISQSFIALSAIVPGLKKMDKASVLGDAIKYVKQLEEKVKVLEDQAVSKTVESAVIVKKSRFGVDDCDLSNDGDDELKHTEKSLPEIEVKISDKSILIKIHCNNRKGMLVNVLCEIEKLHLSVVNTNVIPFASSTIDITIMAQVEEGFSMTAKELVKKLNSAFRQFK